MNSLFQETIFICPACGERLHKARANKRFHGSACRARYFRMKRDIEKNAIQAQRVIANIDILLEDPLAGPAVYNLINDLRDSLSNVYHSKAYLELSRKAHGTDNEQ